MDQGTWNTPHVAHDNPPAHRFHASVVLGFPDVAARAAFFDGTAIRSLSPMLAGFTSAIHAYDVSDTLTFVQGGQILPPTGD